MFGYGSANRLQIGSQSLTHGHCIIHQLARHVETAANLISYSLCLYCLCTVSLNGDVGGDNLYIYLVRSDPDHDHVLDHGLCRDQDGVHDLACLGGILVTFVLPPQRFIVCAYNQHVCQLYHFSQVDGHHPKIVLQQVLKQ